MFFKNILKFTSILAILFLITYLLFPIIKSFVECIILLIDSNRFIIASILILGIILYLCKDTDNFDKTNTKKKNKLFDDETDKEFNRDKVLGLKNIISSHEGDSFFSLALIGDWGSGKSSFLRKLEDEINDEKKDIVIYLNVWELENIQNILQEIEKEFDNVILKFSKSEWLIYHIKSILSRNYFSILSNYFVENNININLPFSNTIKDSKEDYNNLLKRVLKNKKIVLMLDELDRLEAKEDVLDIFKVIRYLTSFDKVFTITGVDINKLPECIELDYTHKIFNSKYVIPKATRTELLNFLREKGSEQQSDFIDKEEFNNFINGNIFSTDISPIDLITNYREAKSILNDTYMICNSLKRIQNWGEFINFEFIFALNLFKVVDLERYLIFMNEAKDTQIYMLNSFNKQSDIKEFIKNKNKIKKLLENENIFIIFDFIYYAKGHKDIEKSLDIYLHHNIPDYMFTEDEYKGFLENISNLEDKINDLKKLEKYDMNKIIFVNQDNTTNQDKFLELLMNRIYITKEKEEKGLSALLEKIFDIYKDKIFHYIKDLLYNMSNTNKNELIKIIDIDIFKLILNSLWKSYFKYPPNNKEFISKDISTILQLLHDNDNIKLSITLYNILKELDSKSFFNQSFTYMSHLKYKETKELFDFLKKIDIYFEEDYETFFEDEIEYKLFMDDVIPGDYYKNIKGKEIKKMINENTELQEEFEKYKESELEKKEEK